MSAAERKIVHMRLKDHPRVETHSEGDEPQRLVVVSPKSR
jgi:spoIIIJ-associated protein